MLCFIFAKLVPKSHKKNIHLFSKKIKNIFSITNKKNLGYGIKKEKFLINPS